MCGIYYVHENAKTTWMSLSAIKRTTTQIFILATIQVTCVAKCRRTMRDMDYTFHRLYLHRFFNVKAQESNTTVFSNESLSDYILCIVLNNRVCY